MRTIATAVVLSVCLAFPAIGQSRHDHDQQWIRQTIREKDRQALEKHYGMPVEIVRRPRHVHRERHYYDRWREARRDERDHRHGHEPHRATRVYGMVMRREQFVERHATSHVECFPPVQEQSGDFANDDKALAEAEVRWQAKVAVQYGMAWADFSNATNRQKMCFRSTFDESWWGRNKEAASQRLGISEGYKKRCTITASPCRAPTQDIDQSRVESRTDTRTEIVEPPRR